MENDQSSIRIDIPNSDIQPSPPTPPRNETVSPAQNINENEATAAEASNQLRALFGMSEDDISPEELYQLQLWADQHRLSQDVMDIQPDFHARSAQIFREAAQLPNSDAAAQGPSFSYFGRPSQVRTFFGGRLSLEDIYLVVVNVILLVSLSMDVKHECSKKLHSWATAQVVIQFLMVWANVNLRRANMATQGDVEERRRRAVAVFDVISRLVNMLWFAWTVVGIVWTFQTKSCFSANQERSAFYMVCFVLSIWHVVLLGVISISCFCCINVVLYYMFCYTNPNATSASNKLIRKTTTTKTYKEGLVPKEDATCAICLSEYEPGDKLRYLKCEHHFHSDCITTWLKKNKVCPFCKRPIDQKDEEVLKKETEDGKEEEQRESVPNNGIEGQDGDDEEAQLVRRA
eukprot:TRINITY_DN5351_c0_g1_i1.p1 TRINITY_DN5351_c0_g1~~TRINITY_DN5351_c0_g1_i1.p1  ORF type:complete len:403 (-),score=83.00 TRINITY_DN5351_c0_g1_i1:1373-2581(-)